MEKPRILMVVKEPEAREAYEEALCRAGVLFHTADSFKQVLQMTIDGTYSGLLVDILTLIRSSKEEKTIAYDCINFYPTLRVKWDPRQKSITFSPQDEARDAEGDGVLARFVENRCKTFSPRSLRRFNRKETYLSLVLSSGDGLAPFGIKTFTVNLSRGGAFVHTCDPSPKGSTVWLLVPELPGGGRLQATVCWSIAWGGRRCIPGIGVMFEPQSDEQTVWIGRVTGS